MDAEIRLSVLIPTYNRKRQLSNTLDALENQTIRSFKIVISDNHSGYEITEVLEGRPESFLKRVTVYRRRQNIGADANIANLFTLCETKWAWLLPDDDIVRKDAVEKILLEIDEHPDAGAFNFSLEEFSQFEHIRIDTRLEDFIDFYYPMHKKLFGDLIYLGNKVFNLERINDCIGHIFIYNYTKVSSIILIYSILENHVPYCTVADSKIIEYNTNEKCSWNYARVVLGTRTLMDIPFKLDLKYYKKMLKISTFDWRFAVKSYIFPNREEPKRWFLNQMYHGLYKYILPLNQRLQFRACAIIASNRMGLNLFKTLRGIKRRFLNGI